MNRLSSLKFRLRTGAGLAVAVAAVYAASSAFVTGSDTKAEDAKPADTKAANTNAADSKVKDSKPVKKVELKKPTGAELYAIHCNRCHAERYPTERTDAQWKTIMMHMQTRAQLPGKDARAILKYLQENN